MKEYTRSTCTPSQSVVGQDQKRPSPRGSRCSPRPFCPDHCDERDKDNDDGTVDADEDDDGVEDVKQGNDEKDNRMKDANFYLIQRCTRGLVQFPSPHQL